MPTMFGRNWTKYAGRLLTPYNRATWQDACETPDWFLAFNGVFRRCPCNPDQEWEKDNGILNCDIDESLRSADSKAD